MRSSLCRSILTSCLFLFFSWTTLSGLEYTGQASFSEKDLTWEQVSGFDLPTMGDSGSMTIVGAPAMPSFQINVALPTDAEVTGVSAFGSDEMLLPATYNMMPFAAPRPMQNRAPDNPFIKDPAVYGNNAFFPGRLVETVAQWDLDGQDFVTLTLYPLQYNPVTGKVALVKTITYEVTYNDSPDPIRETFNFSDRVRDMSLKKLRRLAVNPEDVTLPEWTGEGSRGLPAGDFEYVIITPSANEDDWTDLVDWYTRKGVPAEVVTLDYIYANFSGSNTKEEIRNFVKDAHSTWGTIYFLLGGDTSKVPYHKKNISGDSIPNDTYYSDYDNDYKIEVYVGRASVENSTQIQTFIDKSLAYQKTPPQNFGAKFFFMGFDLDSSTKSEKCKTFIKNNFLDSYAVLVEEYDSESGSHKSDVKGYLNDGQNLINHSDHCNQDVMGVGSYRHGSHLYSSDFTSLSNGDMHGLMYSLGCWALAYDYNDCIGEAWVKQTNKAGHAFVGNSRSGWYSPGSTTTYSMKYDQKFFKVLCTSSYNNYHAGEALGESKNDYHPGSNSTYKYIFTELTLVGDPGLPLLKREPEAIDVQHYASIPGGPQNFPVKVMKNGWDLEGAHVCIWKGFEVYARGVTDVNGMIWFTNIDPFIPGDMLITVTGQNLLPYEGTCFVTGGGGPDLWIDLEFENTLYFFYNYANYSIDVYNTTSAAQTFTLWTNVSHPNGYIWPASGYFNGPDVITLQAYESVHKEYSHYIHPCIAVGYYTMNAYVGPDPGITHEDHETIDILP